MTRIIITLSILVIIASTVSAQDTDTITPRYKQLTAVSVKAKRRYSDTTRIDLSKENFERSVMIDNLFASKYGFSRDPSGQLYYKGKPVSNVQVNGGDFFGKNNLDLYHLLPALVLDNIRVVETNIDSITNTTLLKPILKINLTFKDKYKKGNFGNGNLAAGSSKRYLAAINGFTYKKNEQLSLSLSSNNVNSNNNSIEQPKVGFSPNGNDLTTNSARLTYRNIFSGNTELNLSLGAKAETKRLSSTADLQQQTPFLFSHTFNASNTRSFTINDSKLELQHRIDSLNTITISETLDHSRTRETDSLNYNIKFDSSNTVSQLNKTRNTNTDFLTTRLEYQKRSGSKKGRSLNAGFEFDDNHYSTNEFDTVSDLANQAQKNYFIDGSRAVKENKYSASLSFTEPIDYNSYVSFFVSQRKETFNYTTQVSSDTTILGSDKPATLTNSYFRPGIKFQRTGSAYSINATAGATVDQRTIQQLHGRNTASFSNPDLNLTIEYKFNKTKNLILTYSQTTNYPGLQQLVSLNSSFDLITRTSGNIDLKPEKRKSLRLDYNTQPAGSIYIALSGEFDNYTDKFGYEINTTANSPAQNSFTGNIGYSNSGQLSFSLLKNWSDNQYLSYFSGASYQENPTRIDNKLNVDKSLTFNQTISSALLIIKPLLSFKPILAYAWGRYFYESTTVDLTTITQSDEIALKLGTFGMSLYPLYNYNHNISSNSSFSMNGEIKKTIFKNYGTIWIQAYDIFNSFKFYNNYIGPTSHQSVSYSNLHRYFLLGLSLQFNNLR